MSDRNESETGSVESASKKGKRIRNKLEAEEKNDWGSKQRKREIGQSSGTEPNGER